MNNKEKKGFWKTVFEGVPDVAAEHFNKLLLDITPRAIDWVINKGVEGLRKFADDYTQARYKRLISMDKASAKSEKLAVVLDDYIADTANMEQQKELIVAIGEDISENHSLWCALSLFVQEIECPHCHSKFIENWYDYVVSESSSERNMGLETIYSIECDDFQCPNCTGLIAVKGFIEAYPDGIYNHHKIELSIA